MEEPRGASEHTAVVAAAPAALAAGLAGWLNERRRGLRVAQVVTEARELPACLKTARPSLVVATAPMWNGWSVEAASVHAARAVRLLLLIDDPGPVVEAEALRRGASGVLPLAADRERVVQAVFEITHGGVVASLSAIKLLAEAPSESPMLTARQREVLAFLVDERTTGEIAEALCVTTSTVKSHIGRIAAAFGLSGRREVARSAPELLRTGFLGDSSGPDDARGAHPRFIPRMTPGSSPGRQKNAPDR